MTNSKLQLAESASGKRGTNITHILIVDDHPIICSFLRKLLEPESDLEIYAETGSVSDARTLIKQHHPDVAIIDVLLEDGSGLELIKSLSGARDKSNRTTRYLVFSAQRDNMAARRAAEAGADGFVSKQSAVSELLQAIRTIQSGGQYFGADAGLAVAQQPGVMPLPGPGLLTTRELEVYELIGDGFMTSEIARRLNLSVKTVETHREKIKNKLQLNSGNELLRHAMQWTLGLSTES